MKLLFLLSFFIVAANPWQPDFEKAKALAKQKHELILLNFSGSDWCGPCIRMKKELFNDPVFTAMADTCLVLVNADFPRNKKNQLVKNIIKQNEALADTYNPDGKFPYTVLVDADGKVWKKYDGLPEMSAEQFVQDIRKVCDAYHR